MLASTYLNKVHDYMRPSSSRHTSLPSQNSDSEICPPTTSSLCRAARSGVLRRTLFLSWKSLVGSFTGEPRASLAVDTVRDKVGRASGIVGRTGPPFASVLPGDGVTGVATAGVDTPLRLRLIIFVSSALNFSRSVRAVG